MAGGYHRGGGVKILGEMSWKENIKIFRYHVEYDGFWIACYQLYRYHVRWPVVRCIRWVRYRWGSEAYRDKIDFERYFVKKMYRKRLQEEEKKLLG